MNADLGAPRELAGLQRRRAMYQPELPPCLQVNLQSSLFFSCMLVHPLGTTWLMVSDGVRVILTYFHAVNTINF